MYGGGSVPSSVGNRNPESISCRGVALESDRRIRLTGASVAVMLRSRASLLTRDDSVNGACVCSLTCASAGTSFPVEEEDRTAAIEESSSHLPGAMSRVLEGLYGRLCFPGVGDIGGGDDLSKGDIRRSFFNSIRILSTACSSAFHEASSTYFVFGARCNWQKRQKRAKQQLPQWFRQSAEYPSGVNSRSALMSQGLLVHSQARMTVSL